MEALTMTKSNEGRFTIFEVQGTLDEKNYREFQRRIRSSAFTSHVVLDLSRVERLSSSGLGAVLTLMEYAQEAKRRLYILNPSEIVKIVIDSSGFPEAFTIIKNMDEIL
jgi:anti-anti-sigma factor